MSDKTQQQMTEMLQEFSKQVGAAGGETLELLVQAVYWKGLFEIINGAVWSVVLGVLLVVTLRWGWRKMTAEEDFERYGPSPLWMLPGMLWLGVLGLFSTCLYSATCAWNWMAVCSPKAALAYALVHKLMGGGE